MVTPEELEQYNKLGTEVSKASGKLFDLLNDKSYILSRLKSRAEVKDAQKKAELIRNNPDMDIVFNGSEVFVKELDLTELQARAEQRKLLRMMEQENNFENVVKRAYQELECAEECSEEQVDRDWWSRFQNYAEDISNEDMQILWGKILAGEIKSPGKYSLRTLELVHNLSKKEAELFTKITSLLFISNGMYFLINNEKILNEFGLNYSNILELEDCGLINSDSLISVTLTIPNNGSSFIYNNSYMITFENKNTIEKKRVIDAYPLTNSGVELYLLLKNQVYCPIEYVEATVKDLFNDNNDFNYLVNKVNFISGKNINHERIPIRIYKKED